MPFGCRVPISVHLSPQFLQANVSNKGWSLLVDKAMRYEHPQCRRMLFEGV